MRDELDAEAVARIAARIRVQGPAVVRRARIVHRAKPIVAAGAGALVIAGLAWMGTRPAPEVRACESFAVVAVEESGGRFDMGARALAVVEEGSAVWLATVEPCRTEFVLERGRITVHARDLGGGELAVKSGDTSVIVRGTVFGVAREGERVDVEVAEGRVEVVAGERRAMIEAGEGVRAESGAIERATISEARRAELMDTIRNRELADAQREGDARIDGSSDVVERGSRGEGDAIDDAIHREGVREGGPREGKAIDDAARREGVRTEGLRESDRRKKSDRVANARADRSRRKDAARSNAARVGRADDRASDRVQDDEKGAPRQDPVDTPNERMRRAQEARKAGDLEGARRLFEAAGAELEAAWISLARMELNASRPKEALAALDRRRQRFGEGSLAVEAAWVRVRALDAANDRGRAEREAKQMIERWPKSPYADLAKRWLKDHR
jgi:hypothetical protein